MLQERGSKDLTKRRKEERIRKEEKEKKGKKMKEKKKASTPSFLAKSVVHPTQCSPNLVVALASSQRLTLITAALTDKER